MAKKLSKKTARKIAKAKVMAKKEIARAKVRLAEAERKVAAYAKKDPKKALIAAAAVGAAVGAGVAVALRKLKKR